MQPVLDCFIFDWIEISIQRPWLKQSKSNRVPFNKKRQPPTRFQLLRTQMARRSNKKRSQYQNQPQLELIALPLGFLAPFYVVYILSSNWDPITEMGMRHANIQRENLQLQTIWHCNRKIRVASTLPAKTRVSSIPCRQTATLSPALAIAQDWESRSIDWTMPIYPEGIKRTSALASFSYLCICFCDKSHKRCSSLPESVNYIITIMFLQAWSLMQLLNIFQACWSFCLFPTNDQHSVVWKAQTWELMKTEMM